LCHGDYSNNYTNKLLLHEIINYHPQLS